MPKRTPLLGLSTFHNTLLDGLYFCRTVYELFDQVRAEPNGREQLRLRSTKTAKKLIEELIPIARYVQARYREGRRIRVKWVDGSQTYDAILWSFGDAVENGVAPRKLVVEVTTASHRNDYLKREELHKRGGTFGPKRIARDKKTRQITSQPYVYTNDERGTDLAKQVIERLKAKSLKPYPPGTLLIIICFPDGLLLDSEWDRAVEEVKNSKEHSAFREVFLYEPLRSYSATLYGKPKRRSRQQKTPKPSEPSEC